MHLNCLTFLHLKLIPPSGFPITISGLTIHLYPVYCRRGISCPAFCHPPNLTNQSPPRSIPYARHNVATASCWNGRTPHAAPAWNSPFPLRQTKSLHEPLTLTWPNLSAHFTYHHNTSLAPVLEMFPEKALFSIYLGLWFHCILWILLPFSLIHSWIKITIYWLPPVCPVTGCARGLNGKLIRHGPCTMEFAPWLHTPPSSFQMHTFPPHHPPSLTGCPHWASCSGFWKTWPLCMPLLWYLCRTYFFQVHLPHQTLSCL